MDQVVQQNATLVEQAPAAIESMKEQAAALAPIRYAAGAGDTRSAAASPVAGLLFVLLYGLGNGMLTIVKGTAVARYVDREHVAALNGALGLPQALARRDASAGRRAVDARDRLPLGPAGGGDRLGERSEAGVRCQPTPNLLSRPF